MAQDEGLTALLAIDHSEVPEVRPGQSVRILPASAPIRVVEGTVVQVGRRSTARATQQPSMEAGKYHLLEVQLSSQDPLLMVGARGTAKIQASRRSLGDIVLHELRELLRVPW